MPRQRIPAYRCYKPKNLGLVVLGGEQYYLGKYGTPESLAEYHRLVQEFLATKPPPPVTLDSTSDPTINQVISGLLGTRRTPLPDAGGRADRRTGQLQGRRPPPARPLRPFPGPLLHPLALRAVREAMAQAGLCRTTINARVNRSRRLFKWAVSVELVPAPVYQTLQTVPGLQRGRSESREPEGVRPAPPEHVEATLPHLPRPVAAMVRLQMLTARFGRRSSPRNPARSGFRCRSPTSAC